MEIVTNDKAVSRVIGAELKSGFQSTFEETNGSVYFINVCCLHGKNAPPSYLKMFHSFVLLWQCDRAAVE